MSCRLFLLLLLPSSLFGFPLTYPDPGTLEYPPLGTVQLRILSPVLLELFLVSSKKGGQEVEPWDFISTGKRARLTSLVVQTDSKNVPIQRTGFRRRVLSAPLKHPDLRIGNSLFLQLAEPLTPGSNVSVQDPKHLLGDLPPHLQTVFSKTRWAPSIHVNEVGYAPGKPKHAIVGYYLGDLGEMELDPHLEFHLVDPQTGKIVFQGKLQKKEDLGFPAPCYQHVFDADFSSFETPGCYAIEIPELGRSFPFLIHEGLPAAFARTLALGLYHQRCGSANALPFTRFIHDACHLPQADIPTSKFETVQKLLAKTTEDAKSNPAHTAPPLKSIQASLYPFQKSGKIDVSGGHHDAGDYSKYTINSAQLIHHLVFAADAFPGVPDLDNLGLPESGDGKSDILQIAKWEADFLSKMQDSDGGFYFLVYPRDRPYEDNVLPDKGDPQVVAPKTTSVTAAATAALAQIATSPRFKEQFPEDAAKYLQQAKAGWTFLQVAWKNFGRQGSYQKLTHYGDFAMDRDEIAWAATEMYLATGNPAIHNFLKKEFDPCDQSTWRWSWWSLFEAYGCAARSYAFADKTGRLPVEKLDPALLEKCRRQIQLRARDCRSDSETSAYSTPFPREAKRHMKLGWFFSSSTSFDILVANQLESSPRFIDAALGCLNYEAGCNPGHISFITGLGWRRPHEIVHQYAQNDTRVLPPSGLLIGNIQLSFPNLRIYGNELNALSFPQDEATQQPYPPYDRWGDTFDVSTESTIVELSRTLANFAWWMAQSPLKSQPWKSADGKIVIDSKTPLPVAHLEVPGMDSREALIVWETSKQQVVMGPELPISDKTEWIEAEAQWPDGRRVFARIEL